EGPVSNPAMKYALKGSDALEYPLTVHLSAAAERSFFSLPSTISKNGPTKSMLLAAPEELHSFLFSVYMDENGDSETFDLILQYSVGGIPAQQVVPVTVIDQDADRPLSYPVIVDFSEARHLVLVDEKAQSVIRQAAEDWLYYIDGDDIDSIEAGGSFLDIGGQDHLFDEKRATNPVAYKGYYLFAYGNTQQGPCFCSTGFPNRELLQSSNGQQVPIFRIGGMALNVFGQAFESEPTGWEVLSPYENWTQEGVIGTDMYTLVKHEIGHAMVFENSPLFLLAQGRDPTNPFPDESITPIPNGFTSPAITAYYPDTVVPLFPESLSHLYDVIDPASQTTVYGGAVEEPIMPHGREMLTKLDILIMESVGYPLRDNGVTRPLGLTADGSLDGALNLEYELGLAAQGGIPVYHFDIVSGALPDGLELDSKTGVVSGTPLEVGGFALTFRVKDYDERSVGATLDVTITITDETTAIDDVSLQKTAGFALQQNFPNPFYAQTTIPFDLSTSSNITLKVYNLLGEEVRSLVQEFRPAGTFQVTWDGMNEQGQRMASGVYLYRFAAGKSFIQTRKLVLLE
ncbi:MAG: putative Ig domain-containing protein, partial [Saprospiraceae bacterium]|nr:putative Ig domain-containing protein [Saprospiraceae bacterium]